MREHLFFDLDGTLTNPFEGITRSYQHALECMGAHVVPQAELAIAIGPPPRDVFAGLLATTKRDVIERAMGFFRERFSTVGLYENEVYAGIPEMLTALSAHATLYVMTSKPRIFANRVLEHFNLHTHFRSVYGSELDGRFDKKADLLAHALDVEALAPSACAMIGDREYDILAAVATGVLPIGVTYGFGTHDELTTAGATHLCHEPSGIATLFARATT